MEMVITTESQNFVRFYIVFQYVVYTPWSLHIIPHILLNYDINLFNESSSIQTYIVPPELSKIFIQWSDFDSMESWFSLSHPWSCYDLCFIQTIFIPFALIVA